MGKFSGVEIFVKRGGNNRHFGDHLQLSSASENLVIQYLLKHETRVRCGKARGDIEANLLVRCLGEFRLKYLLLLPFSLPLRHEKFPT